MGLFGLGTEKKTDVEEEEPEEDDDKNEEKTDVEAEEETGKAFVQLLKGLTEIELLKIQILMKYEATYDPIFDDWNDMVKAIKEDE